MFLPVTFFLLSPGQLHQVFGHLGLEHLGFRLGFVDLVSCLPDLCGDLLVGENIPQTYIYNSGIYIVG